VYSFSGDGWALSATHAFSNSKTFFFLNFCVSLFLNLSCEFKIKNHDVFENIYKNDFVADHNLQQIVRRLMFGELVR
jgi:hypothetical protein